MYSSGLTRRYQVALLGGHNVFKWPYKEVHQVGGHNVFKWPYKEVLSGLLTH